MNINDLRFAQARFEKRIPQIIEAREQLHKIRRAFCQYFDLERIRSMQLDEYAIGMPLPVNGFNFCYALERQLDGLGRIIGATAFKFGVYYGKTKADNTLKYRFTRKFGGTSEEALINVRGAILDLLEAGRNKDIKSIIANQLSPMFKGKILCTYYPDEYLNVFSSAHLDYFLKALDLDSQELLMADTVQKRNALIEFKNADVVMKMWSLDLFSHFLYTEYPRRPRPNKGVEENREDPLVDYREPDFPANPQPSFIELDFLQSSMTSTEKMYRDEGRQKKPDYDKEARKLRLLGDRGEKIVMDIEEKRLIDAGRNDLAKQIDRVSLKSDGFGYDILSFETDGTERYIEVKATTAKVGLANFFYTANELLTAREKSNYYIYMVYEVTSSNPKIWPIKNPFYPENEFMVKVPVNYKVTINVKKY